MCNKVKRVVTHVLKDYLGGSLVVEGAPRGSEIGFDTEAQCTGYDRPGMPVLVSMNPQRWVWMHWGLIPRGIESMHNSKALEVPLLNARAETLLSLPTFRDSARYRRCIIPVEGFYEYQHLEQSKGKTKKQQYFIENTAGLSFIAGIWDEYRGHRTFAKITTAANPLMRGIHNSMERQPHQLPPELWDRWFSELNDNAIIALLQVYPDEHMRATAVEPEKSEKVVKPLPSRRPDGPPTLF